MGTVIGDILPVALGVAISPVPIIAVILMLLAPRAQASSVAFLLGWVAGITVAVVGVTLVVDPVDDSDSGGGSSLSSVLELRQWLTANNATVMAVLLLVIGVEIVGKGLSGWN